jgi:hypothetical protein
MINNIGFILNLITFGSNIFTYFMLFIIIIAIILNVCSNRLKHEDKIVIGLAINIYSLALVITAIMISFNIQTMLGDFYGQNYYSSVCMFLSYLVYILFGELYWTFINQVIMN